MPGHFLDTSLQAPEDLPTLADRFAPHLAKVPPRLRQLYSAEANPLDLRPCEFVAPWDESVRAPRQAVWVRAKDPLPPGDEAFISGSASPAEDTAHDMSKTCP